MNTEDSLGDHHLNAVKRLIENIATKISGIDVIPEINLLELLIDKAKQAYHDEIDQLRASIDSFELM